MKNLTIENIGNEFIYEDQLVSITDIRTHKFQLDENVYTIVCMTGSNGWLDVACITAVFDENTKQLFLRCK